MTILGLRTIIYPTSDLLASKSWWSNLLGYPPYYDEPSYVGFDIGGFELGLDPKGNLENGAVTYLGVLNIYESVARALEEGAELEVPIMEVGGGIFLATLLSPQGERFGFILNPNFQ